MVWIEIAPVLQLVTIVVAHPTHTAQVLEAHIVNHVYGLVLVVLFPPVVLIVRKATRLDILNRQRLRVFWIDLYFVVVFVSLLRLDVDLTPTL